MQDISFDIALANSRITKTWRNGRMTWTEFCDRLSKPHHTAETAAEYRLMSKTRQDEVKDVGGYVGGFLSNGIRKSANVKHRQLLTLDLDYASYDVWLDIILAFDCACCLYSTHKHSESTPRYRLIMPVNRPLSSDEYEAVARKVAALIGIDMFDDTTFEACRLMYWQSTSKDGEYVFKKQDGETLNADIILAQYTDWKDTTSWAYSSRVGVKLRKEVTTAENPLEKQGIVGAFCRTYNIEEAIDKYLSDIYERVEVGGEPRYTYKGGSTAAGLVIYDGMYAYSHHSTDPASGKLVNAFDLVRIHLFGSRDDSSKDDTPINRTPSYLAMADWASTLESVKKTVVDEKLASAKSDFADNTVDDDNWQSSLDLGKKGDILSTANNVQLILANDPALKNAFTKNVFTNKDILVRDLPWRSLGDTSGEECIREIDDAGLRVYIETVYGISSAQKVQDAFNLEVEKHSFHPIKDYLNSLHWDGIPRVETLFIDYFGAEDNPYIRAVARKSLTAAVARIFQPGIKWDYVPVLIGEQGQGKSTLFAKLGKEWFSDTFTIGSSDKSVYEQLQGVWIIEIGELAGLRKAEVETIKLFLSKQSDTYRPAYSRRVETFKRQCVFFGTTNEDSFLRDSTGGRRFWPVQTNAALATKDVFALDSQTVDQLWAEAATLYKAHEPLYFSKEVEQLARDEQKAHYEIDERAGMIDAFCQTKVPATWYEKDLPERLLWYREDENMRERESVERDGITIAEIWCELLGGQMSSLDRLKRRELNDILRGLGYFTRRTSNVRKDKNYGVQRIFRKDEKGN